MPSFKALTFTVASAIALVACGGPGGSNGGSRDFVRVVGSSTVYPFATAVSEEAVKASGIKAPVIESTGTGAGMKLFCAGVGAGHPDIENASRRMKASEYADCAKNGVKDVVEVQIGLDGIAFASAKNGITIPLTTTDIYKALAANPFGKPNTAKTWQDVNPALPAVAISVYGPPSTSGTRDALHELILTKGCDSDPAMKALKESNADEHKKVCTTIRTDGAYVEQGENDNLIVQKIAENPNSIGLFGFSFLEENMDKLQGLTIGGVVPTYASISDFSYPGARPLYIYVKAAHLNAIKGLREYVNAFAAQWGPDGVMKAKGMVIAPEAVRTANADVVQNMKLLDPAALK